MGEVHANPHARGRDGVLQKLLFLTQHDCQWFYKQIKIDASFFLYNCIGHFFKYMYVRVCLNLTIAYFYTTFNLFPTLVVALFDFKPIICMFSVIVLLLLLLLLLAFSIPNSFLFQSLPSADRLQSLPMNYAVAWGATQMRCVLVEGGDKIDSCRAVRVVCLCSCCCCVFRFLCDGEHWQTHIDMHNTHCIFPTCQIHSC